MSFFVTNVRSLIYFSLLNIKMQEKQARDGGGEAEGNGRRQEGDEGGSEREMHPAQEIF